MRKTISLLRDTNPDLQSQIYNYEERLLTANTALTAQAQTRTKTLAYFEDIQIRKLSFWRYRRRPGRQMRFVLTA
jgi:hypothetical protein